MPKEYPAEFKTKIIKRYQKGESIQSLSQELHIAQSTLYDWRREYCSIKTANRTYTPKEFDILSRRLEKLEHELEIIRLTGYISNVPLQKKLVFLESLYQKSDNPYSVYELCEALYVARGTFYNHIFRRVDRSKRDQEQARLMRLDDTILYQHLSNMRLGKNGTGQTGYAYQILDFDIVALRL